jgi:hypothetical protein
LGRRDRGRGGDFYRDPGLKGRGPKERNMLHFESFFFISGPKGLKFLQLSGRSLEIKMGPENEKKKWWGPIQKIYRGPPILSTALPINLNDNFFKQCANFPTSTLHKLIFKKNAIIKVSFNII